MQLSFGLSFPVAVHFKVMPLLSFTIMAKTFCFPRKKLQEWREAKGISYKRPPMPVKAPVAVKEEDKVQSVMQSVNKALADCIKLVQEVRVVTVEEVYILSLSEEVSPPCSGPTLSVTDRVSPQSR